MNKNILVTGGSGMVGKYLKNILPEATYMSSKDCDLRDSKQVDEYWGRIQPDVVVHLGAKVGGILDENTGLQEYCFGMNNIDFHSFDVCFLK